MHFYPALRVGGQAAGRRLVPDFTEHISLKPLGRFSPFEVLRNCLDLKLCNVKVICPFAPYECVKSGTFWVQTLGNAHL